MAIGHELTTSILVAMTLPLHCVGHTVERYRSGYATSDYATNVPSVDRLCK